MDGAACVLVLFGNAIRVKTTNLSARRCQAYLSENGRQQGLPWFFTMSDRTKVVDLLMRKAGRGKSAEVLAFVGLREFDDADIPGARRLAATTAARVLGKLRREYSSTGMRGR